RPDAKLFGLLTDLVLQFDALAVGVAQSFSEVRRITKILRRSVGGLGERVFQGYRSDATNRLAERALQIAESLEKASRELVEAHVWIDLNKAVVLLAEAYTTLLDRPAAFLGQERVESAFSRIAEGVVKPRLGPVLMRYVGR